MLLPRGRPTQPRRRPATPRCRTARRGRLLGRVLASLRAATEPPRALCVAAPPRHRRRLNQLRRQKAGQLGRMENA
jgi:hypothetical protein